MINLAVGRLYFSVTVAPPRVKDVPVPVDSLERALRRETAIKAVEAERDRLLDIRFLHRGNL
jgi:hypothetical protein